jgi:hypothetical protein
VKKTVFTLRHPTGPWHWAQGLDGSKGSKVKMQGQIYTQSKDLSKALRSPSATMYKRKNGTYFVTINAPAQFDMSARSATRSRIITAIYDPRSQTAQYTVKRADGRRVTGKLERLTNVGNALQQLTAYGQMASPEYRIPKTPGN